MNRYRIAFAALMTVGVLGTIAACGSSGHGTGAITPTGSTHGTFRYCSYTPDSDGIDISHYETAPCVVSDTRNKSDRKPKTTTASKSQTSKTSKKSSKPSVKKH